MWLKHSSYKGCDIVSGSDDSVMVDKRGKKGGSNYCAVCGSNKVNCS